MPSIKSTTSIKSTNTSKSASTISTKVSSNSNRQHRTLEDDPLIGMTIEVPRHNANVDNANVDTVTSLSFSNTIRTFKYDYLIGNRRQIEELTDKMHKTKKSVIKLSQKIFTDLGNGISNDRDREKLTNLYTQEKKYRKKIKKLSTLSPCPVKQPMSLEEKIEKEKTGQEKARSAIELAEQRENIRGREEIKKAEQQKIAHKEGLALYLGKDYEPDFSLDGKCRIRLSDDAFTAVSSKSFSQNQDKDIACDASKSDGISSKQKTQTIIKKYSVDDVQNYINLDLIASNNDNTNSSNLITTNSDNESYTFPSSSSISTASGGAISSSSNARHPVRSQDSDSDTDSDTDLQQALLGDAKHQDGEKKPRAK